MQTPFPPSRFNGRRRLLTALAVVPLAGWAVWRDQAPAHPERREAPFNEVCVVAPPIPWDRAPGAAMDAPRQVPEEARCPVCGMYPARSPQWASQVIYRNGDAHFFDSPVSLFLFLREVSRYARGRSAADLLAVYVRDLDTRQWLPARTARYVHGSDTVGPMRAGNLPAFSSPAQAQRHVRAHGGRVLIADEITPEVLSALDTRHRHLE